MKSGMLAAEAVYEQLTRESTAQQAVDLSSYDAALRESWVWEELQGCRNIRPGCVLLGGYLAACSQLSSWVVMCLTSLPLSLHSAEGKEVYKHSARKEKACYWSCSCCFGLLLLLPLLLLVLLLVLLVLLLWLHPRLLAPCIISVFVTRVFVTFGTRGTVRV
jgi:hypothetical protein